MLGHNKANPKENRVVLPDGFVLTNTTELHSFPTPEKRFDLIATAIQDQYNSLDSDDDKKSSSKIEHLDLQDQLALICTNISQSLYPNANLPEIYRQTGMTKRAKSIFEKLYVLDLAHYVANYDHLFSNDSAFAFIQDFDDRSETFTEGTIIRGNLGDGPLCRACMLINECCKMGNKVAVQSLLTQLSQELTTPSIIDSSNYLHTIDKPPRRADDHYNYYGLVYGTTPGALQRGIAFGKDILEKSWVRQYYNQKESTAEASIKTSNNKGVVASGSSEAIATNSRSTSPVKFEALLKSEKHRSQG